MILVLILGMGIPAMNHIIGTFEARQAQREISGVILFAERMAVASAKSVMVCPTQDKIQCSQHWNDPWMVFYSDSAVEKRQNPILRLSQGVKDDKLSVKKFNQRTLFFINAEGFFTADHGTITYTDNGSIVWQLVINRIGHVREA
jgi:Tfp pilus assembly protein FimT